MSDVVECVQFKLKDGVSDADFVTASEVVNVWIKSRPGFRYRSLSKDAAGEWRDIVYWESRETAHQASELFMQDLCHSDFMQMIDEASVLMNHSDVKLNLAGACG
ncbi:MAG: hypothetical protein H6999_08260 [Hahellaceae bacterium]|nr:hypothetical protein [Hahellaceae bacterium]MCP5169737.1 hypothetical protein [Hahellaceae bacterium]